MLFSQNGGLRLELVPPDGPLEGRDSPFLSLSDAGRFSTVYLARILMGPTPIRTIALKVRRATPRADVPPTNPQVDERWDRELATLRAAASPDVVKFLDPGSDDDRGRPVLFCTKVRKAFHPLCPSCLAPLRDCRDDDLLRSAGLTPYSEGASRYVACSACVRSAPVYYSPAPAPEGSAADVRPAARLARDGGAILRTEVSEDARERLERQFPCFTCEHREECYPEGAEASTPIPAESRLVPLSFHDLQAIPMELLPLGYDELSDLLGGAEWPSIRMRAVSGPGVEGRAAALSGIDTALASGSSWFHRSDRTGRFPLEVLRLKLALFGQAARGVRGVHEAAGRAILGVTPASVMADLGASGGDLPAFWSFRAKVVDVGGEDPGPDGAAPAADLPGLMKLYFRALLVNDAQDEATADQAVARVAERLKSSFPEGTPVDLKAATDLLKVLLDAEPDAFSRSACVFVRDVREARENLIPPALWFDLMVFGFRLGCAIPGFGFAIPPEGATMGPVDRALEEFTVLLNRAQVELMSKADRSREIRRACESLLADLSPARSHESTRMR